MSVPRIKLAAKEYVVRGLAVRMLNAVGVGQPHPPSRPSDGGVAQEVRPGRAQPFDQLLAGRNHLLNRDIAYAVIDDRHVGVVGWWRKFEERLRPELRQRRGAVDEDRFEFRIGGGREADAAVLDDPQRHARLLAGRDLLQLFASNDTGWLSVSSRYTSACPNLLVASFRILSVNSMSFVRWL